MKALFSLVVLFSLNTYAVDVSGTWTGSAMFQSTLEREPMILADVTITIQQTDQFISLVQCVNYDDQADKCRTNFYTIKGDKLEMKGFEGPVGQLTEDGFMVGLQDSAGGVIKTRFAHQADGTGMFYSLTEDAENRIELGAESLDKGSWNAAVTQAIKNLPE